jgi:hypothetical protein
VKPCWPCCCERKPTGALAGILAAYLLLALDPLLLPGVLFALFTVAATRPGQRAGEREPCPARARPDREGGSR